MSFHSRSGGNKYISKDENVDEIYCKGAGKPFFYLPFVRLSRHSNVISNWYLSVALAGLLRTLTPRSDTTDMMERAVRRGKFDGGG